MGKPIIISLFDYSGTWSNPYKKAGYRVIQVDIKRGQDILKWNYKRIPKKDVVGILAAPPCTDFTVSGNQHWDEKDRTGQTALSVKLVKKALEIIKYFKPNLSFYALENPVGRIAKLVPELGKPWYFQPYHFGDPWTKKTGLWGSFNLPLKRDNGNIRWSDQGSWSQILGGKSEKTKAIRSVTPAGFAIEFFKANNPANLQPKSELLNLMGRCKYGMWTCEFAVSCAMCDICEEADNYEPNEYAMEFDTEKEFMLAVFDKGNGILASADPQLIYS